MSDPLEVLRINQMQSQSLHAIQRSAQREAEIADAQRSADTSNARNRAPHIEAVDMVELKAQELRREKQTARREWSWKPRRGRSRAIAADAQTHVDIMV